MGPTLDKNSHMLEQPPIHKPQSYIDIYKIGSPNQYYM